MPYYIFIYNFNHEPWLIFFFKEHVLSNLLHRPIYGKRCHQASDTVPRDNTHCGDSMNINIIGIILLEKSGCMAPLETGIIALPGVVFERKKSSCMRVRSDSIVEILRCLCWV